MNILEFFKSHAMELPKNHSGENFYKFLENCFSGYLKTIGELSGDDKISESIKKEKGKIERTCRSTLDAIKNHYMGHPARAYEKIHEIFKFNEDYLQYIISPEDISEHLKYLFRIRIGNNTLYEKKDLFHIPFEMRHTVMVQRYSIPGVPSLYLGGSAYICWEEFDRPDFHKIHLARFASREHISVLEFGYRPSIIASMLEDGKGRRKYENFAIAQAVFWPLLCASSIRVFHREAPFKPEYLIPQYILQWIISNSGCDGIRYFSCRLMHNPQNILAVSNFVFPTKSYKEEGFCDSLLKKFVMSEPLSYQVAKAAKMKGGAVPNKDFTFEPAKGYFVDYENTEFYEMEMLVSGLDLAPLENGGKEKEIKKS